MHVARKWQPNAPAIWGRRAPKRHVQPLQQPHLDRVVSPLLTPEAYGAPARPCSISAVRTYRDFFGAYSALRHPRGLPGLHTTRYQYKLKLGIRLSEPSSESYVLPITFIESTVAICTL